MSPFSPVTALRSAKDARETPTLDYHLNFIPLAELKQSQLSQFGTETFTQSLLPWFFYQEGEKDMSFLGKLQGSNRHFHE